MLSEWKPATLALLVAPFLLTMLLIGAPRCGAAPAAAGVNREAQLRVASTDPYLTSDQRAFYAARLQSLETGSLTPMRAAVDSAAAWTVYAESPRRTSAMVVQDVASDRLILFGGVSLLGLEADVWVVEMNGERIWRKLHTIGPAPAPRLGAAVCVDPLNQRLLLYGGTDEDGAYLDDFWALALDGPPMWTALTSAGAGPGARANAGAVVDTLRNRWVVFGGTDGSFSPPASVWALPFVSSPQWSAVPTAGIGPGTPGPTFYDGSRDEALVFVGYASYPYTVELHQLSLGTPATWSTLTLPCCGPSGSNDSPVVFDPVTRTLMVWASGFPGYLYRIRLNATIPSWESSSNPSASPPSRSGSAVVFDSNRRRTLVVGGHTGYPPGVSEVWSFGDDPQLWSPEVIPLQRRSGHAMVLDVSRHELYLFGGVSDTTATYSGIERLSNGLWQMSLGDDPVWRRLPGRGGPMLGRSQATLVHDTARDRLVLFGGQRSGVTTNEVWVHSLIDTLGWQRLMIPGTLPHERAMHGAVYDPVSDRMIVLGGWDSNAPLEDVWALEFAPDPRWLRLQPEGVGPGLRSGMGMAFDPDSMRVLLAGGTESYGNGNAGDCWSLDLLPTLRWRQLIQDYSWSNAYNRKALLSYDPVRHRALLAQSYDSYGTPRQIRVRSLRPGRDSGWTLISTSGPPPPWFTRPVGCLDPTSGRLFVQGEAEGDIYTLSDERTFALTLLNPLLDVPGNGVVDELALETYPNPAWGSFHVRWTAATAAPVELDVFDMLGRRVVRHWGHASAGPSEFSIGSQQAPMPAGIYLVRARIAGTTLTRRVAVLR